jgi:hypothetical protein
LYSVFPAPAAGKPKAEGEYKGLALLVFPVPAAGKPKAAQQKNEYNFKNRKKAY